MSAICFVNVHLLAPEGLLGSSLRVDGDVIAGIDVAPQPDDLVVDGRGGLLAPGLINAHDHLEFNSIERLRFRDGYRHSTEWFDDIRQRMDTEPAIVAHQRTPLP